MSDIKSPLRTIRENCIDCSGTAHEVELCPVTKCKLWPYRFGHDPRREKRVLTDAQRENIRNNLARKNTSQNSDGINGGGADE